MKFKNLLFLSIISLQSCQVQSLDRQMERIYPLASAFTFVVKENGKRLTDSVLDGAKLTYYEFGQTKYVNDFRRADQYYGFEEGVMDTQEISIVSGVKKVKNFLLVYPDGTFDSLYVNIDYLTEEEALANACRCLYPIKEIRFNNKIATVDSSCFQAYLFEK